MGSTVEQDRSHLAEQVEYGVKCGRFADETRSKSSTRQAGRNDGYTFLDEETQKFQDYANINQNYWNQKMAAVERLPCSTMERTIRWSVMLTASWTKRLISRQPF